MDWVTRQPITHCICFHGIYIVVVTCRSPQYSLLPSVSTNRGVSYNRVRCKPVFKPCGKSMGSIDFSILTSDDITDETSSSSEDPFYIGMMTNKNAGNPFHKYLVKYVTNLHIYISLA